MTRRQTLFLDGAAISATANGDTGVTVQLAGGGSASVTFERNDIGATLVYNGTTTTLAQGFDELAE